MFVSNISKAMQKGFTLIELTIGIAVLSVALLVMTGSLFPQAERSTDPWMQVRSAELANSMMNEVLSRKFDANSYVLGDLRCGEFENSGGTTLVPCVDPLLLGNCAAVTNFSYREEGANASRDTFDDIDDYHCLVLSGDQITQVNNLQGVYDSFTVRVTVGYVGAHKLVTVSVTPPRGGDVVYSAYRTNY